MEHFIETVLTNGVTPPIVVVALGFAVYKLYNRNQELNTTLYEVGRESARANEAMAASLNRLTDVLRARGSLPE